AGTGTDMVLLAMTGSMCLLTYNGTGGSGDGIDVGGATRAGLENCSIFSNHGHGVLVTESAQVNLGDNMFNPGGNVLQSAITMFENTGAGLCNRTGQTIKAQHNYWSQCPPSVNSGGMSCSGAIDFGTDGSGGAVDSTDCKH